MEPFRDLNVKAAPVNPSSNLPMHLMLQITQGPRKLDTNVGKPMVKGLNLERVQVRGCGTLRPAVTGHAFQH